MQRNHFPVGYARFPEIFVPLVPIACLLIALPVLLFIPSTLPLWGGSLLILATAFARRRSGAASRASALAAAMAGLGLLIAAQWLDLPQ